MCSNHKCNQDYFVENSMGETVPITVLASFVKGHPQDIHSSNQKKVSQQDEHQRDPGRVSRHLHSISSDKRKRTTIPNSIEFIGEPTDLSYLLLEEMDWTLYNAVSGYEMWHH